jgi:hypothetical protein
MRGKILLLFMCVMVSTAYSQKGNDSVGISVIRGTWIAEGYTTGQVEALSKGAIDSCLGEELSITKSFASVFGDTCFTQSTKIKKESFDYLYKRVLDGTDTNKLNISTDSGYVITFKGRQTNKKNNSMFFPARIYCFSNMILVSQNGVVFIYRKINKDITSSPISFEGVGDFDKDIPCRTGSSILIVEFSTFTEPDNIVIKGNGGKVLFESGMITTDKLQVKKVIIDNETPYVHLIIKASTANSKWRIKLRFK